MEPFRGESCAPDHPNLKVTPNGCAESRNGAIVADLGVYTADVVPFAKTLNNVVWGIKERIFYVDASGAERPPCVRPLSDLSGMLERISRLAEPTWRLTVDQFLATRPSRTRAVYGRAACMLAKGCWSLRELSRTKLFVKWEKTRWTKPQVPRIINPRDPAYNILVGQYLVPMEKAVFKTLTSLIGQTVPCVAKGRTNRQRAADVTELFDGGWCAVGLDASRFDQCVGETMLKFEHAVYKLFNDSHYLQVLLKEQLNNRGVYRGKDGSLSCKYGAIRCSGDQNTSLGNCLISVCLALLFCEEHEISCRVYCDGDDLLLFVPPTSEKLVVDSVKQWYLQWGFRMKVEPTAYSPSQVEFCQSRIVDVGGPLFVRNPIKAMDTDFVCYYDNMSELRYRKLIHAVGSCGMALTAGCPIMQEWYAMALRVGLKPDKTSFRELENTGLYRQAMLEGGWQRAREVTITSRLSFSDVFGISVAEQLMLEEHFRSLHIDMAVNASSSIPIRTFNYAQDRGPA